MPTPEPAALEACLATLLPAGTAVAACRIGPGFPLVGPGEEDAAGTMGDQRRQEFTAGRHCARRALGAAGGDARQSLPVGPGRVPQWPDGFRGTITHGGGLAAAAVARGDRLASLGIDVELPGPLEPALVRRIARPGELAALARHPAGADGGARLIFSAKESAYKCLWPLTGQFLDFHDLELTPWPERPGFRTAVHGHPDLVRWVAALELGWRLDGGLVTTAAWIGAPG